MRLLEEGDLKLPWGDSFYAIKGGQFEMLKWLRQLGCPWPLALCAEAILTGRK